MNTIKRNQNIKIFNISGIICILFYFVLNHGIILAQNTDYPYHPVKFSDVQINDAFWKPRITTNQEVTIPFAFNKCKETGRLKNFEMAALKNNNPASQPVFCSRYGYDDSDVYKIIEGASYSLAAFYDPALDSSLDTLIADIAAAQEPDGYLYTMRTVNPEKSWAPERWINARTKGSHELYNVGHLYEAAVAHFYATGKKSLLNVALKNADLLCNTFGPDKKTIASGHQEIEIGLCKLYKVSGEKKYLDLAKFLLDQRGVGENTAGEYTQDHKPVVEQDEAVGHAVRANYMYSAMADVAALTGDKDYINAIDKIWENVTEKKLYITGGVGATSRGEAYGANYELPNLTAYNETCAAIANVYWNYRMFLLHGNSKYFDVLERTLYNGLISGVSMDGTTFFYPNPLQSTGDYARSEWFDCSCCPSNITRFISSLSGYIYAVRKDSVFVNMFIGNTGKVKPEDIETHIGIETGYPWTGESVISVDPAVDAVFSLCVRIPGWATNEVVPGNLYSYSDERKGQVIIKVNGITTEPELYKGYAVLNRTWKSGDKVDVSFPMNVRTVIANKNVAEDVDKVSFERGPIVFCAESTDNENDILSAVIPALPEINTGFRDDLLNGVQTINLTALFPYGDGFNAVVRLKPADLNLIPYYAWAHRGNSKMNVWFDREGKVYPPEFDPPGGLFVDSVRISLKQYENQDVFFTTIGENSNAGIQKYNSPVLISGNTCIKAWSSRMAGNESPVLETCFERTSYKESLKLTGPEPDSFLSVKYYEELFRSVRDIEKANILKTVVSPGFDILSIRDTADFYGMEFSGFIKIPTDDVYTFSLESDDGSVLYIDDIQIVDNDGVHGTRERSGQCALRVGFHKIRLLYFEYDYGEELKVKVSGKDKFLIDIPESWLFHRDFH